MSDPLVTKCGDRLLDLSTDQWNLLDELKPSLHVLQVATPYLSLEYNVHVHVSITTVLPIVHGIVKSMELTEEDSASVCQNDIEDYFKQIQTPRHTSLDWWKVNKYMYALPWPLLGQKYLTITVTCTR